MDLHHEIMNIRGDTPTYTDYEMKLAWKEGHRDARHAAAELTIPAEQENTRLRNAIALAIIALERDGDEHGVAADLRAALTPNAKIRGGEAVPLD